MSLRIKSNILLVIAVFALTAVLMVSKVCAVDSEVKWNEVRGDHFTVFYGPESEQPLANQLLVRAEQYYRKISDNIGYSRYSNFWTWDERVKIIMFPDQRSYMERTGKPSWSHGFAFMDQELFKSKMIVTFRQQEGFLDGLLPHEISHLILRDFIGFDKTIPTWFDEGVAQLQEADTKTRANQLMQNAIRSKKNIPFDVLGKWDIRNEEDHLKVALYYSQSVSVVDFLIKTYGSAAFGLLCRNLKDGENFEDSLRKAYGTSINSIPDLEKKWIQFMSR